jgi:hypothetical protein
VTFKKRPMGADGSSVERRKTRRFPVVVPIEVSWQGTGGTAHKEDAVARQVNANGGFLKMSVYPDLGNRVMLTNFLSAQMAEARVIAAPHAREGVSNGVIVELVVPNENFWGAELQTKKTIVELENLEKALQCEDMDLPMVKEYRESVESIRKAADTLGQLREYRFREDGDNELFAALAADRTRRAIALCVDVAADLDAARLKEENSDLNELSQAVDQLAERLERFAKSSASSGRDSRNRKLTVTIPMARNSR